MALNSEDQEMRKIYQESLHPKGYGEDSKFGKYQKVTKKEQDVINKFRQDMRKNVNKNSFNADTIKILAGVGILIIVLVFALIPFLFYAK